MVNGTNNQSASTGFVKVRLGGGWTAQVPAGAKWVGALENPESLLEQPDKELKRSRRSNVVMKSITVGSETLRVAVKRVRPRFGVDVAFGRAGANLRAATKLLSLGIPAAKPLAAIRQGQLCFATQSIYISEYIEGQTLYDFLKERLCSSRTDTGPVKEDALAQVASIFARLHRAGLWNRDAKASNFVVRRNADGKCEIFLTDMDGIKRYGIDRHQQQFRPFWHLIASLMSLRQISRADWFGMFETYCVCAGIDSPHRKGIFSRIMDEAKEKYERQLRKNILIIKPSALGDIVLALPALAALRTSFPDAKISWLVRPEYAPLLQGHPDLTDLIMFDRKLLARAWFQPRAFRAMCSLFADLRRRRFNLVFDFQGLFRTGFFAWMTGCKKRFGIKQAREFAHLFYTDRIPQDSSCIHLVDYYLKMVVAAGAQQPGRPEFNLPEDAAAAETADRILRSQGVNGDYIVLVPGAARNEKCWSIRNFSEMADAIAEKYGLSIVATGSEGERATIEILQELTTARIVNLAGKTSVRELTALLRKASLVISNDTGPGHIAAAMNVPIVMIFGPTNPARVCPYNRPDSVAAVEPTTRRMKADSYDPRHDIRNVTFDQVWQKVARQLQTG